MLKWLLTGGLIPVALLFCGVFFLIYLRGYPFRAPRGMLDALRTPQGDGVSPFRALMQALAGTLGVGNIVGVANAIAVGGAGAIFWMWGCACLAMILKYAEILLAVAHRRVGKNGFFGGAVYYVTDVLGARRMRVGRAVAVCFSVLMIVNALSMGCMIQVSAVSESMHAVVGIPPWLSGAVLVLLVLPLLMKGSRGVSALTEYLVPIMTAGYVILSVAVLILRRERLDDAFAEIFTSAFSARSAACGVIGFLTSRALRVGTMRGLLSNEAGCGTAPTAHAEANTQSPAAQGVWGICEVLVDTVLLCTLTALVLLVGDGTGTGVMATVYAYSSVLGGGAAYFMAASVLCFGFATLICWGAYGLESLRFLTAHRAWRWGYLALFCVCILVGACRSFPVIWEIADFAIAAMTAINLAVLLLGRREIRAQTLLTYRDGGRGR
ncbi:MAG: sodium:alanine symporter family protein [Clostridia bacterium]|nr:sodium:alanine symporter family protein [Clostridia bacterium]